MTSELIRVELASAMAAAQGAGRLPEATPVLDQFDADCAEDGPISLLALRPAVVFAGARRLLLAGCPLRTLDAIHLSVALHEVSDLTADDSVLFVTRDARQASAVAANGLELFEEGGAPAE